MIKKKEKTYKVNMSTNIKISIFIISIKIKITQNNFLFNHDNYTLLKEFKSTIKQILKDIIINYLTNNQL